MRMAIAESKKFREISSFWKTVKFPIPAFDVIWMSQFLDCFSEEEVTSICRRAAQSMDDNSRLYIKKTAIMSQKRKKGENQRL